MDALEDGRELPEALAAHAQPLGDVAGGVNPPGFSLLSHGRKHSRAQDLAPDGISLLAPCGRGAIAGVAASRRAAENAHLRKLA